MVVKTSRGPLLALTTLHIVVGQLSSCRPVAGEEINVMSAPISEIVSIHTVDYAASMKWQVDDCEHIGQTFIRCRETVGCRKSGERVQIFESISQKGQYWAAGIWHGLFVLLLLEVHQKRTVGGFQAYYNRHLLLKLSAPHCTTAGGSNHPHYSIPGSRTARKSTWSDLSW
jgi:hypothetical protein